MKNKIILGAVVIAFISLTVSLPAFAQVQAPEMLKRTTYKTDKLEFGSGGTLSIIGAPNGSIRVEGWSQNEIEISAEIEIQARTLADLDKIGSVTGFVLDESMGRTGIITIGTHDKKYLRRVDKKFPKALIGLPFKVDYVVKVPKFCDLQIDGGTGDLYIAGVDGSMKINYLKSDATLDLIGGGLMATFGDGNVNVSIPTRSWRGRFADVSLITGTMNVQLPPMFNGELDANVLRTGQIENVLADLKPRTRKGEFTDKSVVARSGNGGVPLKFTVGDGTLKLGPIGKPE